MIVKSIELKNFRNYKNLCLEFDKGISIFYGDNAQGKTNLLEAFFLSVTTKSYRNCKDKEFIMFGEQEAHIKTVIERSKKEYIIDFHIKDNQKKGIAINKIPIKRAGELLGLCNVVFFTPEDLNIIKQGPSYRRRFIDMEISQVDKVYLNCISYYRKLLNERNILLKNYYSTKGASDLIEVIDQRIIQFGTVIIKKREEFIKRLNSIINNIYSKMTAEKEIIKLEYNSDISINNYKKTLEENRQKDINFHLTGRGPHRDDIVFKVNENNIKNYGSQGQLRTAALALKLAEIQLLKEISGEEPILLLDDVMSELDKERQKNLLNSISDIQTFITCTGVEDYLKMKFKADKLYHVEKGNIKAEK